MKINIFNNSLLILFSIFPISIITGSFLINLNIFLISIVFITGLILKIYNFKDQKLSFYLIFFFTISLIINLFFSNNITLSYPRVIKIFFIIFFVLSFGYIIKNIEEHKIKNLYKIWLIIFIIVNIDLLIEYFSGKNIIGLTSIYPGKRLASFTGLESVIGNFYLGFCLLALSYFKFYIKTKNSNLILALFFILVAFLIGERANFIRSFIIISFYLFLLYETKVSIKISAIISMIILFTIFLNFNQNYKTRYYNEIGLVFQKGVSAYLKESNYGAHRNVAIEIFKDNPIFGVGIKNFRVESSNKKYDELNHKQNHLRVSTHPHELYHELLSETGLFGLLSF